MTNTLESQTTRVDDERRLSGKLGTWQLMLTVLAFAAPIAVATGFVPIGFIYSGQAAPTVILLTLVVMLLFTVGYVAMTKHIRRPGAFYSYISAGLGKIPGVSSAFLAAASYFMILVGAYAFTGVLIVDMILSFGGPETSWILWAVLAWATVVVLGFFNVDVSVKVMVTVMILEIILIVMFDIAALLFSVAEGSFNVAPFQPSSFDGANLPITMVFAVLMFVGFEGAAIYRDETRNPDVTVPRATYGAILLVGILHFLTSFSMNAMYGDEAAAMAAENPGALFLQGIGMVLFPMMTKIAVVVVTTSQYASAIAVHNVTVRYVHSLALDGALPRAISKVHPKFRSPYLASTSVEVAALIVLLLIVLFGAADDPTLYAQIMGVGLVGLVLLMGMVSLSVLVFFGKRRSLGENPWRVVVAPFIAFVALIFLTIFNVIEFAEVHGGNLAQAGLLFGILGISIIGGIVIATYYRVSRPERYALLGAERLED